MTGEQPQVRAEDADQTPAGDPNVPERAYLRRRAFQEIALAIGADDPAARIPHDQLAHAYCMRCRAIRDPAECAVCALQPLCRRLANRLAEQPGPDGIGIRESTHIEP